MRAVAAANCSIVFGMEEAEEEASSLPSLLTLSPSSSLSVALLLASHLFIGGVPERGAGDVASIRDRSAAAAAVWSSLDDSSVGVTTTGGEIVSASFVDGSLIGVLCLEDDGRVLSTFRMTSEWRLRNTSMRDCNARTNSFSC